MQLIRILQHRNGLLLFGRWTRAQCYRSVKFHTGTRILCAATTGNDAAAESCLKDTGRVCVTQRWGLDGDTNLNAATIAWQPNE